MTNQENKLVVGCEEWFSLPDLGIPSIKARVDSGAKTSSMHAFNIQAFRRAGVTWVSFEVHPLQGDRKTVIRCERPVVDKRVVKSSSGLGETRYVIAATIKAGDNAWDIELTLANRDSMGYRMLLGREAMIGRVLVDPSLSFCLGQVSQASLHASYDQNLQKTSGLKIGVLASDPELYSNRRLIEAGEQRGHEMVFLNIKQCYMRIDAIEPEVHYRGGKVLSDLDAVITRIRPSVTYYGCAIARQFESMGVYTYNSSVAIAQSRDKLFSLQLLLKNDISIPTTGFANSPMDTGDLMDMVGGAPLLVKLLEGTQGRGVILAETKKAAEGLINGFKSLNANLLVQKFIKEANGKNLRCIVIGNKVVASIQCKAAGSEFNSSLSLGGTASLVKITAEEKALVIKATKTLGLKMASVDIIRSNDGPLLLEVNSTPNLEAIETATGKDIASLMVRSIEKKLGWIKKELND